MDTKLTPREEVLSDVMMLPIAQTITLASVDATEPGEVEVDVSGDTATIKIKLDPAWELTHKKYVIELTK